MRHIKTVALALAGVMTPLVLIWIIFGHDFIVMNNMNSVQRGWWVRTIGAPRYGDVILFDVPENVQSWIMHKEEDGSYTYAKAVHWLRTGGRILKPVAGIEGDTLCRDRSNNVFINDVNLGTTILRDKNGLDLPFWDGCFKIGHGEYAVISQTPDSLDSKIFGLVRSKDVVGRYVLLWAFH